jgi:hypothetical protein
MRWLTEGVDEGKGAGKRKSTGTESFLPTQLTCLLWLQGAESDIIMNSLIICSITGLQAVKQRTSTYHLSWLSTIRQPCLSRNLNQVRVEVCFLVISSR